jgi:hypothetical protein
MGVQKSKSSSVHKFNRFYFKKKKNIKFFVFSKDLKKFNFINKFALLF